MPVDLIAIPKTLGSMLILLIVLSIPTTIALNNSDVYVDNATIAKALSKGVLVKGFIKSILNRIHTLTMLAKNLSIKLPEKLSTTLNKSLKELIHAHHLAIYNPRRALQLTMLALKKASPALIYILRHLPKDILNDLILSEVKSRVILVNRTLSKFRSILDKLKEHNVVIPEDLENALTKVELLVSESMKYVEEGNVSLAKVKSLQALKLMSDICRHSYWRLRGILTKYSIVIISLKGFMQGMFRLISLINGTIKLIEHNETDKALTYINTSLNVVSRLRDRVTKYLNFLMRRNLTDTNISKALSIINDTLSDTCTQLTNAFKALREGRIDESLSYLGGILELLRVCVDEVINYVKPLGSYIGHKRIAVILLINQLKRELAKLIGNELGYLVLKLNLIEAKLKIAIRLYKYGKINETLMRKIVENIENELQGMLREAKQLRMPLWLLHRIAYLRYLIYKLYHK